MDNYIETSSPQYQATLAHVKEVIGQKAWYSLDAETGAFNWPLSIFEISASLGLSGKEDLIREAFETSYSPDCLTNIKKNQEGNLQDQPLIEAIRDLGLEEFIWTVGDMDYQRKKFIQSGVSNYFDEEHYHCVPFNKFSSLRDLLHMLKGREKTHDMHVIVVDDKDVYTNAVKALRVEYDDVSKPGKSFTVSDYYMNLKDDKANAQAFYDFVFEYRRTNKDTELVVIFDFDGAVADTNSVITGPVAEKIAKLLLSAHR